MNPTLSSYYQDMTILITGASSGIGKEMAMLLATVKNTTLLLNGRNQQDLQEVAEQCQQAGAKTHVLIQDLAQPGSAQQLINKIEELSLKPDAIINNAGIGLYGELWKQDPTKLEEMMTLNMTSLVILMRGLLPHLLQKKKGGVLNIASIASFVPCPGMGVYGASKSFVKFLTESVRVELEGTGVNAVCYHPGGTDTKWHARAAGKDSFSARVKLMPANQVAQEALESLATNKQNPMAGFKNAVMAKILWCMPKGFVGRNVYARTKFVIDQI